MNDLRPLETELRHVGALSQPFVGALPLTERLLGPNHVEDVVHDLEEHTQLAREGAEGLDCVRFARAS